MNILKSYHRILAEIELFHQFTYEKPKAGGKPEISDQQVIALLSWQKSKNERNLLRAKLIVDGTILPVANVNRARESRYEDERHHRKVCDNGYKVEQLFGNVKCIREKETIGGYGSLRGFL